MRQECVVCFNPRVGIPQLSSWFTSAIRRRLRVFDVNSESRNSPYYAAGSHQQKRGFPPFMCTMTQTYPHIQTWSGRVGSGQYKRTGRVHRVQDDRQRGATGGAWV